MRRLLIGLLFALAPAAEAAPLKVVSVAAPAINCIFTTASPCSIRVTDTAADVPMSAGGTGRLQTRTFKGLIVAPSDGMVAYEYRLKLVDALSDTNAECIDWMS